MMMQKWCKNKYARGCIEKEMTHLACQNLVHHSCFSQLLERMNDNEVLYSVSKNCSQIQDEDTIFFSFDAFSLSHFL